MNSIQDGGPDEPSSLRSLEMLLQTLHCENDQTKLIDSSRTGMFNLIVKDPRRIPPKRAALDQGISQLSCESSNSLHCLQWLRLS